MTPVLKAYRCSVRGCEGEDIRYGLTASKVRYQYLLDIDIDGISFADITVLRASAYDLPISALPPINDELDDSERGIVIHAYGGSSASPGKWGYRSSYCCASDDKRLQKLASLGLFSRPCRRKYLPRGNAYFYLTDSGKQLAQTLSLTAWMERQ